MPRVQYVLSSLDEISNEAQKGLKKISALFNDTIVWIEEVVTEGRKTLQLNDVALLPKTPSATAARKSRRRVQRRSSAAGAGVRRNLRNTSILSETVAEVDESLINTSTDSTVSNKGGRKRGLKNKAGDAKQKKAILQEITNCVEENSEDVKKGEGNKENESSKRSESNSNKGRHVDNDIENKLQATLEAANQIVNAKPDFSSQALGKGKKKSPDAIVDKKRKDADKISSGGSSIESAVAHSQGNNKKSDDGKLNMQPVVVVDATAVEKRLSHQSCGEVDVTKNSTKESDKEHEESSSRRSSRRSSTVKKAKLNVARLSTSRRSIKLTATKSQQETMTVTTIQAAKNPSGKSSNKQDDVRATRSKLRKVQKPPQVIDVDNDDDDDTMIEDTPPEQQQQGRTRSKMAVSSKPAARSTSATVVGAASKTGTSAAAAGDAGRTTRSKVKVKEIEKALTSAASNDKFKKPVQPSTPGRTKNIGSKVQQMQELLFQDAAFGLRPSPKTATPKVERHRRSGKRIIEVTASPARTVTPKRLCKDKTDSGGTDSNGTVLSKSRGLQMSNGSSHVKSVVANFKKSSAAPTNVVTSFGQRTTPKVASLEEVLEQKRKELSEKDKRHNVLIQRRLEEQQRKLEETRKLREEHLKQVQIRRIELEQAIASKKHASAQKTESTCSRLNRADDAQRNEETLRKLAEEEEALNRELAPTSQETVAVANDEPDRQNRTTRSSRSGLCREEAMEVEIENTNSEQSKLINAERLEQEKLEKERLENDKVHEQILKEKQLKELQENEARKAEQEKEERERERLRLEQELRKKEMEQLLQEQKLKQKQELLRLKAEREKFEREQKEFERQKEQERIKREKHEAARKAEEAQARERIRLEAERRMKEEQDARAQQLQDKYKQAANNRINQSTNNGGSMPKKLSVSLSDVSKQYKGGPASTKKSSGAMRVSPVETSKPVVTGGPARVAAPTPAAAGTKNLNTSLKPAVKQAAAAAHNKQDGLKTLNRTFDKEGDTDSYDMTPAVKKKFAPSTEENYNINDLNSEDSTDDEEKPRKKIPLWAQGTRLKAALINQCVENFDAHKLFGELETLDLNFLFKKKKPRFNKRTSSAIWDEFPSFTRP